MKITEFMMTIAAGVAVYLIVNKLSGQSKAAFNDGHGNVYSSRDAAPEEQLWDWSQPNRNALTVWL